jgi:hypothetical protein
MFQNSVPFIFISGIGLRCTGQTTISVKKINYCTWIPGIICNIISFYITQEQTDTFNIHVCILHIRNIQEEKNTLKRLTYKFNLLSNIKI